MYSIALNRIKLNVLLIMDFIMFIFECPAPFSVNLAGDVEYLGAKALLPLGFPSDDITSYRFRSATTGVKCDICISDGSVTVT